LALLQVENLTKEFGGLKALNSVCFDVSEGEILGVIGPNGAGKTTCFNLLTGYYLPTAGKVVFKGEEVTNLPDYKRALYGIVRTFQHTNLFPKLTVFDNILIGCQRQHKSTLADALLRRKKFYSDEELLKAEVKRVLAFIGMQEMADMNAENLSYGDQRKLEIAIALAANPEILLLDEPAAGMNPSESAGLLKLIKEIQKLGITTVLVEHDMKLVMNICERIIVLNYGVKIAEGTPYEIRNNPQVVEVYLGKRK